ncbi:alpha/beta fold hydrolase [Streptomyces sp. GbtcB6]|uniref:alpha/beta fold hydrolase n=1 Tax=Streptomyces sp. GbtcB6 TaxID=2824751 RepID=UPI0020C6B944|nr:alpha/beta hydrolase [Streptomyces sp. GbtcB6]
MPSMTFRWRRTVFPATALVLAASVGLIPLSASGADAARPEHATTKPTIVLVHGAFADAGSWAPEVTRLHDLGYTVYAPANPLRSLSGDAAYIKSFLQTIDGPVVLVGHSYGGAVITEAAAGLDNVKALVYVAAFALDKGESAATVLPADKYPGSLLTPDKLVVRDYPDSSAPGGTNADLYINPGDFRSIFANDNSSAGATELALTQRPLSQSAFGEPLGVQPAWKTIPTWDLVTLDDHAISPAGQKFMAARAHAKTTTIRAAHDVSLTRPDAVDKIIIDAATSNR